MQHSTGQTGSHLFARVKSKLMPERALCQSEHDLVNKSTPHSHDTGTGRNRRLNSSVDCSSVEYDELGWGAVGKSQTNRSHFGWFISH